jgi:CubicO group peptidase (beta-lactamase class C family)
VRASTPIASLVSWLAVIPAAAAPLDDAPWPTDQWPRAAPAEQGLAPERLEALVGRIRAGTVRNIHSLLVVRHGWLVLEEYFNGHGPDELHMLQSVSKSVTSALVGIAVEEGLIRGVDEPVVDFFPGLADKPDLDPRRERMTVEDLLTMRSGTDYHERGSDSPHFQLNRRRRGWTELAR